MSEKRWVLATAAAALWLASAVPAMAGDAVALVMSVSGQVSPKISAYSEIQAETAVDLGADGRISFVHYPSCRQVTVVGGTLTFSAEEVSVEGGTVERESPQKCPKKLQMKTAGVAAAVRTRAFPTPVGDTLSCVLVGERNHDYAEAQVIKGDRTVVKLAMNGPVFEWPANQSPLEAGSSYKLKLVPAKPTALPQEIDIVVVKGATGDGDCLLSLQ